MSNFNHTHQYTQDEKLKRHQVFNFFLSQCENKKVKSNGQFLPFIFHEKTKQMMRIEGRTPYEIFKSEQDIIRYAGNAKSIEIIGDIPRRLHFLLKQQEKEHLISENRIVPVPTKKQKLVISEEITKYFTDEEIALSGCFYRLRDFGLDGKITEGWRLDVGNYPQGFILPCLENGLITALRVSRNENDNNTFILRSRYVLIDNTRRKK